MLAALRTIVFLIAFQCVVHDCLLNIAQRGQEMVQGFDNDRLIAQGQTYAYNMAKAQLSTLIGAETVAGLQHGVPVVYKTGKAIAQRLQGMPTTKEEAIAYRTCLEDWKIFDKCTIYTTEEDNGEFTIEVD